MMGERTKTLRLLGTLAIMVITLMPQQIQCDELFDALNGIHEFMEGPSNGVQNRQLKSFYNELVGCLNDLDDRLLASVNAQWAGFKKYGNTGGNPPEDPWNTCPPKVETRWFENTIENCTVQAYGNLSIWEPCNYASNLAYYHTTTEICWRKVWSMPEQSVKAIGKAFASLGVGSSFMHGSNTKVGGISDVRVNDLFGYITYTEAVQDLPAGPVVKQLSRTNRTTPPIAAVDELMLAYIEAPVAEWGTILTDGDFPELRICMCGTFGTILTFLFPEKVVDQIVVLLLEIFDGFDEEMKEFCLGDFLTEIRVATSHIELPKEEKSNLLNNTLGTLIKLIYAFVWQEEVLVDSEFLLDKEVNTIGKLLLPLVNAKATQMTNFEHSSRLYQAGRKFFPGQDWCDAFDPHSKWHLETAIALPDLAVLGDELHRLIKTYG